MSNIFSMRASTLIALCALSYLLAAGQTVHACFCAMKRSSDPRWPHVLYEVMLVMHLVLACAVSNSAIENRGHILLWLHPVLLPIEPLLWVHAAAAVAAILYALRLRRWGALAEAALLLCSTPAGIALLGQHMAVLLVVDVSYFAARVVAALAFDLHEARTSVSRLSIIDALDALPEGVMWINAQCEVLFMNDAMRGSLTALGFRTDLADATGLWERLEAFASETAPDCLLVETTPSSTCLFVRDEAVLRGRCCQQIMALDVSEEAALGRRLASVNRLLEAANEELGASMAQVRRVAEEEAVMRMKIRVHDTVGSRLSILHRYLEDGRDDSETLRKIAELLSNIADDLADSGRPAENSGLASIVRAFALIGVEVQVTGELPADKAVAAAFAEIVLEAVTNAAKHAQATCVAVQLEGAGGAEGASLTVTNDGASPAEVVEGTGIPGMRRAAAEVGATFEICSTHPFTVRAVLPPQGDGGKLPDVPPGAALDGRGEP